MPDFRWQSLGGCLLDGNGDIAMAAPAESALDMIRTRLKADLNGWKLYPIGADLQNLVGQTMAPELETTIQRQVSVALTNQLLSPGQFEVQTVTVSNMIDVYVYIQRQLLLTLQVNKSTGAVRTN